MPQLFNQKLKGIVCPFALNRAVEVDLLFHVDPPIGFEA